MNGPCGVHCDRFNAYLKALLLYSASWRNITFSSIATEEAAPKTVSLIGLCVRFKAPNELSTCYFLSNLHKQSEMHAKARLFMYTRINTTNEGDSPKKRATEESGEMINNPTNDIIFNLLFLKWRNVHGEKFRWEMEFNDLMRYGMKSWKIEINWRFLKKKLHLGSLIKLINV